MSDEDLDKKIDEQKAIFDAIIKEWLDEKFAQFGRWTFYSLLAVVFVLVVRALLSLNPSELKATLATATEVRSLAQ